MIVFFDLDGVLLNTAELIKWAYKNAGVDPPDDMLGAENGDWLAEQTIKRDGDIKRYHAVKAAKNREYVQAIHTAHPLSGLDAAMRLHVENVEIGIISGSPIGTMRALRRASPIIWRRFTSWHESYNGVYKRKVFFGLMNTTLNEIMVYVDDQRTCEDVLPTGWRFVHYTGQRPQTLYDEIIKAGAS
jgi:phosphoserine phosphatase